MARVRIINVEPIRRFEQAVGVLLTLETAMIPTLVVYPNDLVSSGERPQHLHRQTAQTHNDCRGRLRDLGAEALQET
jgi:hypothetical protein